MDIDLLKTFLEVSRTRHFGKAAENLYLTQSAVSFRIRQLEGLLGAELFTRHRNNIRLTASGAKLLPLAESSVMLEQRILVEVAQGDNQTAPISIGSTSNLWDTLLQKPLQDMMTDGVGGTLDALAHTPAALVRMLSERSLDLALLIEPPKVEELKTQDLGAMNLKLYSSRRRVNSQSAFGEGYVLLDWGTAFKVRHSREIGDLAVPVFRTNMARLALESVLNNGGATYLPEGFAAEFVESGELFQVSDTPIFSQRVYASYYPGSERQQLVEQVEGKLHDSLEQAVTQVS